jgi:hexosaminidase
MKKRICKIICPLLLGVAAISTAVFAERSSDAPESLNLRPQPQEVALHDGGFRVTPDTRIIVQFGHQSEDRIAAETLAEEISDQSGLKLDIVGTKDSSKADGGAIVLARLQDRRVRRFLAGKGLRADQVVGDQGYLLFSDKSHLIVAANTGEGLFYGVQTLRQLLRPMGKNLVCPSVTIRDWPNLGWQNLEKRGDLSRDTPPPALERFMHGPGA